MILSFFSRAFGYFYVFFCDVSVSGFCPLKQSGQLSFSSWGVAEFLYIFWIWIFSPICSRFIHFLKGVVGKEKLISAPSLSIIDDFWECEAWEWNVPSIQQVLWRGFFSLPFSLFLPRSPRIIFSNCNRFVHLSIHPSTFYSSLKAQFNVGL